MGGPDPLVPPAYCKYKPQPQKNHNLEKKSALKELFA